MKDLRQFLKECEEKLPNEFVRVTKEVDPKYEISAIVTKLDIMGKHPLMFFENVKNYNMPVVCNTDDSLTKLGLAFGVPPQDVENYYDRSEQECLRINKYPIKEVKKSEAPCKEVIKLEEDVNLYEYPFITHHEGEAPYLTRAIGITYYEEANCLHAAHYRLMVKKPDLGITHINLGRHLWYIWKKKNDQNKPLEIAFVIGIHPGVALASQSRMTHPPSELDLAGSLLKESLEVVRCETIDLLVPANAEIVIEGEIPPNTFEDEGPWGDVTRYHQKGKNPPVKIKAITHRKNPIIHDMGAWQTTGFNAMMQVPLNVWMNRKLKEVIPDIKKFRYGGHMCGFIQLNKKHIAQPKQAILAAFANDLYLKYVVCFDTDIDITKGSEILWALTTRVQADRDIMILSGIFGSDLDLSCKEEGVQTKVGIDATAKPFRKDFPPIRKIPEEIMNRIDLNDYIPNLEKI